MLKHVINDDNVFNGIFEKSYLIMGCVWIDNILNLSSTLVELQIIMVKIVVILSSFLNKVANVLKK